MGPSFKIAQRKSNLKVDTLPCPSKAWIIRLKISASSSPITRGFYYRRFIWEQRHTVHFMERTLTKDIFCDTSTNNRIQNPPPSECSCEKRFKGRGEKSQSEVGSIFIYMLNASVFPLLSTSVEEVNKRLETECWSRPFPQDLSEKV